MRRLSLCLKVIQPSTKQQLLQSKHTPILPPSKSSVSNSRHPPTSPRRADSESTNVDSSDSEDSYEDVMSGDEEESVVKSRWTNNTPSSAEVSTAWYCMVCMWSSVIVVLGLGDTIV